jgi:hypothetical protein
MFGKKQEIMTLQCNVIEPQPAKKTTTLHAMICLPRKNP